MKLRSIGITFLAIGIIMIAYTGFSYVTTDKIVDLGAIKITKQTNHPVKWTPVFGAVLLAVGVVIIAGGKKVEI